MTEIPRTAFVPCDMCRTEATGEAGCRACERVYYRCEVHGGAKGALRSLHSHCALYHPRKAS